jgi:hypothetical protein
MAELASRSFVKDCNRHYVFFSVVKRNSMRMNSIVYVLLKKKKSRAEDVAQWCKVPIIPALRRQGQEDREFKASVGNIARAHLEKKNLVLKDH